MGYIYLITNKINGKKYRNEEEIKKLKERLYELEGGE